MLIRGQYNTYDCKFVAVDFYAEVQLRIPGGKTYLFGVVKVPCLKLVWQSSGKNLQSAAWAKKLPPTELKRWYVEVIHEYEKYLSEWEAENAEEASRKEKTLTAS